MNEADGRLESAHWLTTDAAAPVIAAASAAFAATPHDPLLAGSMLRARFPDLDPTHAAAALEQASLLARARRQYGITDDVRLTRDGLEQATRDVVARRRAQLFVAAGARRVLDLTAGLGFDARAYVDAGLEVTAVERDSAVGVLLRYNCPAARVVVGDSTEPRLLASLLAALSPDDVVFVDPARRDPTGPRDLSTGRSRTERDPDRWSPPWHVVASIPHPRVAVKVAPAFTPPAPWQAEWVSVERTVVECAAYSWEVSGSERRAVVFDAGTAVVLDASGDHCPVGAELAAWLHEPDPAVVRSGAVGTLLTHDGDLRAVDLESSWLTGPTPSATPLMRSFRVRAQLAGTRRQQRRMLADLGVRRATVKSRDVTAEPRQVLRDLGLGEGPEHVVVLTRRAGRLVSYLTEPAAARSS